MNKFPNDITYVYEHFTEYSEIVENRIRELKSEVEKMRKELFALRILRRSQMEKK